MLAELRIKKFALIDELELQLSPGLNVLSGETGAGKSIIIDALSLLLGGRGSQEYIRSGAEKCLVEGLFILDEKGPAGLRLLELGYELEEKQLFLSRELTKTGRNICRIQGKSVPLTIYKELGSILVDIHGQQDYQSLLRPENHLELLDSLGTEILAIKLKVAELAAAYQSTRKSLDKLLAKDRDAARREDMLKFQVEEIGAAGLQAGEDEELARERLMLVNAEKLANLSGDAYQLLYSGQGRQQSALESMGTALSRLKEVEGIDSSLGELVEGLQNAYYQIEEAARELRDYLDSINHDPLRLEQVDERLILIKSLKRKYGDSIAEIESYFTEACAELEQISRSEETLAELSKQLSQEEQQYRREAQSLSNARRELAAQVEKDVVAELADLYMPNTKFSIAFELRDKVDRFGQDSVEFMFSPNRGEPVKALVKVASGGELSRVILALKTILAKVDPVPTLVFDEVDSGVGGEAVRSVAKKLSRIGQNRQVLCVTHSPHVAALAGKHFSISKELIADRTITRVLPLDYEDRLKELARMLGGISQTTLQHASEMLGAAN